MHTEEVQFAGDRQAIQEQIAEHALGDDSTVSYHNSVRCLHVLPSGGTSSRLREGDCTAWQRLRVPFKRKNSPLESRSGGAPCFRVHYTPRLFEKHYYSRPAAIPHGPRNSTLSLPIQPFRLSSAVAVVTVRSACYPISIQPLSWRIRKSCGL